MLGVSKKPYKGKLENICNNKSEKRIYQNLLYAAEATEYNVESWIRYEN